MNPEKDHSYEGIDWAYILMRLNFVALSWAAGKPDVFDGISAQDVVAQVLSDFFEDPDGFGWDPRVGPLDRFLLRVLRNKTIDHYRRQRHIAGSLDDPDFAEAIQLMRTANPGLSNNELLVELKKVARGEPDLTELLKAIEIVGGGHNINQQLAEVLKTTPRDIVNRKKRLIRRYKGVK